MCHSDAVEAEGLQPSDVLLQRGGSVRGRRGSGSLGGDEGVEAGINCSIPIRSGAVSIGEAAIELVESVVHRVEGELMIWFHDTEATLESSEIGV